MVAKRRFGKLEFEVSVVGFGGASVSGEGGGYGFGTISESDAVTLLQSAREQGINLFDTAPIYGFGTSEKRIGKAFKSCRESVFIVSKCGVDWDDQKRVHIDNDPKVVEKMLHNSLRDLGTDYLDLYMIHWPDPQVDIRRPMESLLRFQDEGKIRAIGLCNTMNEDYTKAAEIGRIEVLQSGYNLFERRAKQDLWPLVKKDQLGFMAYGTFDKGILTGRATANRKYDEHDLRSRSPQWLESDKKPKFEAVKKLQKIIKDQEFDLAALALQSLLSSQEVSTALCGIKNLEQLQSTIAASESQVPSDIMRQVLVETDIELQ